MNRVLSVSLGGVFFATLALACGGAQPQPVETASRPGATGGDMNAQRMVQVGNGDGSEVCTLETVYFAFDDHQLDARSRAAIDRAVTCWRQRGIPSALHLTGATDPHGTTEYNMALGERRAQSVRAFLSNLGVEASRISVMSVGEEEASGEDESGWARDRFVRNQAR